MELRNLPFEQAMTLRINYQDVEIMVFKKSDDSNIKFGINAPSSVQIDREKTETRKGGRCIQ